MASKNPGTDADRKREIEELVDAIFERGSEEKIRELRDYADGPKASEDERRIIKRRSLLDHVVGSGGSYKQKSSDGRVKPKPTLKELDKWHR